MRLLIVGGGTGGHVFPGIAIAQALKQIDPSSQVLFVGTQRGIEKTAVPKAGFAIQYVDVRGLKGHSMSYMLKSLWLLPMALVASFRILKQFRAEAVIGTGGYASGPVILAAWLMRIPIAICEPNSIPGFTNQLLAKLSRRVFGGFQKTGEYFSPKQFRLVGNPLREEFCHASAGWHPVDPSLRWGDKKQIAIVGGSLGARVFNEIVPQALSILKTKNLAFDVLHQTGKNDEQSVRKVYQDADIVADVKPFIDNMVSVYQNADILIARSGAAACAEIAAVGVASILVPFPHAIYDHQTENAKELALAHAAILLPQTELTAKRLADEIETLLNDESRRHEMAKQAKALGRIDAANQIAKSALVRFVNSNT